MTRIPERNRKITTDLVKYTGQLTVDKRYTRDDFLIMPAYYI